MKTKILFLLFSLPLLALAGDPQTNCCSDEKENTKISLYIPGFIMKVGALFIDRDKDATAKEALSKLRSMSICVREGNAYQEFYSEKYDRKMRKLDRQNFEELIVVRDAEEKVSVQLRENKKGKIRQLVVIADDGSSEFVFVRLRCNVSPEDLGRWMNDDGNVKDQFRELTDI